MFRAGILNQQTRVIVTDDPPLGLFAKLRNWYDMDESGTGTRVDQFASDDMTLADGATSTTGLINNALLHDGNSQAQTPNNSFTGDVSFAVNCFVHPSIRTDTDLLFWRCWNGATGASVPGDWDIEINNAAGSNLLALHFSADGSYNSSAGDTFLYTTGAFPAGETHMLTAQYNSATALMEIARDLDTMASTTLGYSVTTAGDCLRLGRMTSSYPHGLEGWMDCIGIYNEGLTVADRTWLFNAGAGRAFSELLDYFAGHVIMQTTLATNDVTPTGITLTNVGSVTSNTDGFSAGIPSFSFTRAAAAGITIDDDPQLDIGTRDFTVESWVKTTSGAIGSQTPTLWANDHAAGNGVGNPRVIIGASVAGRVALFNGAAQIESTTNINDGTWHHIALCRKAGVYTLYIDGTAEGGTYADTTNLSTNGMGIFDWGTNGSIDGEVAMWRLVVGGSLYRGNFTPPLDLSQ